MSPGVWWALSRKGPSRSSFAKDRGLSPVFLLSYFLSSAPFRAIRVISNHTNVLP